MKYTFETMFPFMEKQVKIIDDKGKEWTGLCWGVYSGTENEDDYGVAEDSLELLEDGTSWQFFSSEIASIKEVS